MIYLELETISPLHLSANHAIGPLNQTLDYIPGRALRGALAGVYQQKHGLDAHFNELFLKEGNWFGPLLPTGHTLVSTRESFVLPTTAYTCKQERNFKAQGGHGVRDMLFEFLKRSAATADRCQAAQCEASLVPFSGFYSEQAMRPQAVQVSQRLVTRTALDSRTETAAHGQLFTLSVIEESHCFAGFLALGDAAQEQAFAAEFLVEGGELWIGADKTRGQGQSLITRVEIGDDVASELLLATRPDMATRLGNFDQAARQVGVPCPEQTLFTLTLLSDAIVRDSYLRYQAQISPAYLAEFLHPTFAQANSLGAFSQTRTLDGWNAAHRLPQPTEVVIAAGSVFAFGSDMPLVDLANHLATLERTGIGERRIEGFGRVLVAHPFHLKEAQV
jgi:CRISPR-associated protein Csx10